MFPAEATEGILQSRDACDRSLFDEHGGAVFGGHEVPWLRRKSASRDVRRARLRGVTRFRRSASNTQEPRNVSRPKDGVYRELGSRMRNETIAAEQVGYHALTIATTGINATGSPVRGSDLHFLWVRLW